MRACPANGGGRIRRFRSPKPPWSGIPVGWLPDRPELLRQVWRKCQSCAIPVRADGPQRRRVARRRPNAGEPARSDGRRARRRAGPQPRSLACAKYPANSRPYGGSPREDTAGGPPAGAAVPTCVMSRAGIGSAFYGADAHLYRMAKSRPNRRRKGGPEADPGRKRGTRRPAWPYGERLICEAAGESLLAILPEEWQWELVTLALGEHMRSACRLVREHPGTDAKPALVVVRRREEAEDIQRFLKRATGYKTIGSITGSISVKRRVSGWDGLDIVCATPEMLVNDMERGIVSHDRFALAVFVGARWAVGRHAYAKAARRLAGAARILAVTDALPRSPGRRIEMLEALGTTVIDGRPERSPDCPPSRGPAVECVAVDLPPETAAIRDGLRRALHDMCAPLCGRGCGELKDPPLSRLAGMQDAAGGPGAPAGMVLNAVIARYMLDTLEVHGPERFLDLCEWCRGRPDVGELLDHPPFAAAVDAARGVLYDGQDHPKLDMLADMLAAPGRALVVADPDGPIQEILRRLGEAGVPAAVLRPDAGAAGLAYMERTEAVDGLRGGRYRVLVSADVEDAYTGMGDGHLVPGDVDLIVCYEGGVDAARPALDRGAARVVALVTAGSTEDPGRWAANQLDWSMCITVEENRAAAARKRSEAGLAARDMGRPEYRLLRRHGEDVVLGPAGAGGTFVDAAGEGSGMVCALLGGSGGREGGRTVYAVHDSRPAEERPQRLATPGQKAAPYALIKKLDSPGRNMVGAPTKKWKEHLRGETTVGEYNATMRAGGRALQTTVPPEVRPRNRLIHMAYLGIYGRDGRRLSLYATAEGRLYNAPADGPYKEGHRKILDYKLVHEIRGKAAAIRKYVVSVADRVMEATGGKPEFVG